MGFFLIILGGAIVHFAATLGTAGLPKNHPLAGAYFWLSWPLLRVSLRTPDEHLFLVLFLNSILWSCTGVGVVVLCRKWGISPKFWMAPSAAILGCFALVMAFRMMIRKAVGPSYPWDHPAPLVRPEFLLPLICIALFFFALLPVVLPAHHLPARTKIALKTASTFSSLLLLVISLVIVIWIVLELSSYSRTDVVIMD